MDMKFLTNEYRFTFFETPGTTTLFIAQFTLETCPVFFQGHLNFLGFPHFWGHLPFEVVFMCGVIFSLMPSSFFRSFYFF